MFKLFVTIALSLSAISSLSACDPRSAQFGVSAIGHQMHALDNFGEIMGKGRK